MKTSPARDADTLRFTLCDDQDMGDMTADPCWRSSVVVKPTTKPPCVETSGRSKSSAASDMGHCVEVNRRDRMNQKSHALCLLQLVHSAVGTREVLYYGSGY